MKGRDGDELPVNRVEVGALFPLPVRFSPADPVVLLAARVNALDSHLVVDALAQPGDARTLYFGHREVRDIDIAECPRGKPLFIYAVRRTERHFGCLGEKEILPRGELDCEREYT